MIWEIQGEVPQDRVSDLEDSLCEESRSFWSISQVQPGDPHILSGYYPSKTEALEAWRILLDRCPFLADYHKLSQLEDEDWKEAHKQYIRPWKAGPLHWVPVWERDRYSLPAGDRAVYLDAGMAFGTGCHETTRLCAQELINHRARFSDTGALQVIDAGCGSGILAISAKLLGYGQVYGFDRDPEAIRISWENALNNGLSAAEIDFREGGVEEGLRGRRADLILANIQADILRVYVGEWLEALRPRGTLVLSGILERELPSVKEVFTTAFAGAGLPVLDEVAVMGEWASLTFRGLAHDVAKEGPENHRRSGSTSKPGVASGA